MTRDGLVTAPEGTSLEAAEDILRRNKIEKLAGRGRDRVLCGLITVKDIFKRRAHPNASKDSHGRLLVGAAVGAAREDLAPGPGAGRMPGATSSSSTPRTATPRVFSTPSSGCGRPCPRSSWLLETWPPKTVPVRLSSEAWMP